MQLPQSHRRQIIIIIYFWQIHFSPMTLWCGQFNLWILYRAQFNFMKSKRNSVGNKNMQERQSRLRWWLCFSKREPHHMLDFSWCSMCRHVDSFGLSMCLYGPSIAIFHYGCNERCPRRTTASNLTLHIVQSAECTLYHTNQDKIVTWRKYIYIVIKRAIITNKWITSIT